MTPPTHLSVSTLALDYCPPATTTRTTVSRVLTSAERASLLLQQWIIEQYERQRRKWLVNQHRKQQQQPRCGRCEGTGHAHPQCTAVVTLVDAPNPPLHVYFDAGLLPPLYHYTDYSRVFISTPMASLPPQNWVIEQRQRQQQQHQQQLQQQQFLLEQGLLDLEQQQLQL